MPPRSSARTAAPRWRSPGSATPPTAQLRAAGQAHPTLRSRLLAVAVLGGLAAFGPLSIDMYLPAFPAIGDDLGASASAVQLTLTACLAGLALGQLVAGPLSDRLGRRPPLIAGVALYVAASLACAVAPSAPVLGALRLLQGLAGSAGLVIARAVVADLYSGDAAARFFSNLMVVSGLAPILAPLIGGQVLELGPWRLIFVVLATLGAVCLASVVFALPESLPPERRRGGGLADTFATLRELARDRSFIGVAGSCGLAFGAMFAYIAGSPFVVQEVYGASAQLFSALFALNAIGIALASQLNHRLVGRFRPVALFRCGVTASAVGGLALLGMVTAGRSLGLVGFAVPLFVVVAAIGLILPNGTTMAMAARPDAGGSASALLGVLQFLVGALAAPLVGIAGSSTGVPMAVVIAVLSSGSLLAFSLATRSGAEAN